LESNCYVVFVQRWTLYRRWSLIKGFTYLHQVFTVSVFRFYLSHTHTCKCAHTHMHVGAHTHPSWRSQFDTPEDKKYALTYVQCTYTCTAHIHTHAHITKTHTYTRSFHCDAYKYAGPIVMYTKTHTRHKI